MDPRLDVARRQIEFARGYTLSLVEDVDEADWFRRMDGCPTHIAWQVGHLAMAEYGLALFRQRGRQPEDTELMSSAFRKRFSRGSDPNAVTDDRFSVEEIRSTLDSVHKKVVAELAEYPEEMLDEPIDEPYAAFATKLGGLLFCSHHELIHAGQIGLIRRQFGLEPVR